MYDMQERIDDYLAAHRHVWPEMLDALRGAGIRNYTIFRDGASVFAGSTSLAELKRDPKDLVSFLFRDNSFPAGCFLLTGTGVVPPDSFTLKSGDEIAITIEPIGTLKNTVA